MSNSIANYFSGIAAKRLSKVEIILDSSNQHEFHGSTALKKIFGTEKIKFQGKFIFLTDNEDKIIKAEGTLTWYDSRKRQEKRTSEFRLYYTTNDVVAAASVNDLVVIGRTKPDELLIVVAQEGSTAEKQLKWLFNLSEIKKKFIIKDVSNEKKSLGFAAKYIIESLGMDVSEAIDDYLDLIIKKFGSQFPVTFQFSEFARSTIKDVSPIEAPDETLIKWMEREELLFKTFERHLVSSKLKGGFGTDEPDVDKFVSFSLSVQNRRKSRAGYAFEHHLSRIFDENKIKYSKGKVTELKRKPDFIFPGIIQYHQKTFDQEKLTMLGVKTTAKDRWRQVLSEAARIKRKHLITLEPAISKNQTDEMLSENLKLVVPKAIFETYSREQQKQIITLKDLIALILQKQRANK